MREQVQILALKTQWNLHDNWIRYAPFLTDGVSRRHGSARHNAVDDGPRVAAGGDGEPGVQGGRLPLAKNKLAERGGPAHSGKGPQIGQRQKM